jgi:3-keto-L-gulonate-6-phosphate decarboxylase
VTSCVVASEGTSRGLVRAAKELGKESWLDLIAVPATDYAKYVDYVNDIGPDYICAHMASDVSKIGSEGHTEAKKRMIDMIAKLGFKSKIVLSGGITVEDIPVIRACNPHHVNIGSAFLKSDDPAAIAKIFAEA